MITTMQNTVKNTEIMETMKIMKKLTTMRMLLKACFCLQMIDMKSNLIIYFIFQMDLVVGINL